MSKANKTTETKKKDLNPFADLELRSLRDYFMIIRERWLLAIACSILLSCLVGYFLLNRPAIYEASSSLLIERQGERVVDMQQVVDTGLEGGGQMWAVLLQNHVQQIGSRTFLDYVIASFTEAERKKIIAPYLSEDPEDEPPAIENIIGRNFAVENLRNSFVLKLSIRHRDAEAAALIADRFASRYIHFMVDRTTSGNAGAVAFLTEQAEELRQRVEEAEQELQAYRQKHNVVSLEDNQNIIVQRLKDVSSSVTAARMSRLALEGQLKQVEEFRAAGRDLLEINFISRYGSIPTLGHELEQLRSRREVMGEKYAHRHPRMIENERAIAAAEKLVADNIQLAMADLRSQLQKAQQQETHLQAELESSERESLNLDRLTIQFNVLRRNVDSHRGTYAQILERLNQTTITSQLDNTNVKLIDRAQIPPRPVEPNLKKVALLVLFLGGFVFVGVPLGLEFLDNKLKTAWDVEHFLDQKLVGEIPSLKKMAEKDRPHVVENDINDNAVEAFRGLFSQMQLASSKEFPKSLLITSTIPGEGKSFIASNLGFCFAAHGKKTLLIDCDFRRPVMHTLYEKKNEAGTLRWLEAGGDLSGDLLGDPNLGILEVAPGLFLLRAGGHTKKATETITHPKLDGLLSALRRQFDMMIIDTSPLGIFPDALALATYADEAMYATRFGKVNRQQVKNFIKRLEETDAEVLGVVMNDMPTGSRSSYYYSGYGYSGNYKYAKYYAERS